MFMASKVTANQPVPTTKETKMINLKTIEAFAADGLIQLHWQDPNDLSKTLMVAQGDSSDFETSEEAHEWIREVIERRKDDCPEGWRPMICDSTSKHFWVTPAE